MGFLRGELDGFGTLRCALVIFVVVHPREFIVEFLLDEGNFSDLVNSFFLQLHKNLLDCENS